MPLMHGIIHNNMHFNLDAERTCVNSKEGNRENMAYMGTIKRIFTTGIN